VEILQIEPEFGISFEIPGQPERRVGTDAPAPMDNFADARGGNVKIKGQLVDGEPKRLHKVLKQDFTRVNRGG
jgi:hypothetical protein